MDRQTFSTKFRKTSYCMFNLLAILALLAPAWQAQARETSSQSAETTTGEQTEIAVAPPQSEEERVRKMVEVYGGNKSLFPPAQPTATASTAISDTVPSEIPPEPFEPYVPPYTVSLRADGVENLRYVTPGDKVALSWELQGWTDQLWGLELRLDLPQGVLPPLEADGCGQCEYYPEDNSLRLPMNALTGSLAFEVQADAIDGLPFEAGVFLKDQWVAYGRIELLPHWITQLGPEGGQASGFGGRVQMDFPAAALQGEGVEGSPSLQKGLEVEIRLPDPERDEYYTLNGTPIEILAYRLSSEDSTDPREEVHKFSAPISITVRYDEAQIEGEESTLHLYYYDEELASWMPWRSYVDADNNTVTALTDHLTVSDLNAQNWEAARLPSLEGFQVAQFTGAATFGYPIQAPPGPGGLQPGVSLAYNSQTVDDASGKTQASWVGMGWSLDVGSIVRSQHGTIKYLNDDTFSINANGVGGMMLEDTQDTYHTADESFWRIVYDDATDVWTAWDKEGNQYIFGEDVDDRARYPRFDETQCANNYGYLGLVTWTWALSRVRNKFGKEIIYNYTKEGQNVNGVCPNDPNEPYSATMAIYPSEIIYPHNRYRVYFYTTQDRGDHDSAWHSANQYTFYQLSRLREIRIQQDADGDGNWTNAVTVHKYTLTYADDIGSGFVFPGLTWPSPHLAKTLTLLKIQEWDGGSLSLPAYNFTYGDGMHLTQADNGYGGRTEFTYEAWNDLFTNKGHKITQVFGGVGQPCYNLSDTGGWGSINGNVICDSNHKLKVTTSARKKIGTDWLHPGGVYQMYAEVKAVSGFTPYTVTFGLDTGSAQTYGSWFTINTTSYTPVTVTLSLNSMATENARYLIRCTKCTLSRFSGRWLPTYYRVKSQTSRDLVTGKASTYTYRYDGPATNTMWNSSAVYTSDENIMYVPPYSEFRGHSRTQQVGPDGRTVLTFFNQSDGEKGLSTASLVGKEEFSDDFERSSLGANWTLVNGLPVSFERYRGDKNLLSTGSSTWKGVKRSTVNLADGDGVLLQFMVGSDSTEAKFTIDGGTYGQDSWRRWGVYYRGDTSDDLVTQYCYGVSATCEPVTVLYTGIPGAFQLNTWYTLLLLEDDNNLYLRVWPTNIPGQAKQYSKNNVYNNISWYFIHSLKGGSSRLDAYNEGLFYSLGDTVYSGTKMWPNELRLPRIYGSTQYYTELTVYWTYAVEARAFTFEGDATYLSTRNLYDYAETAQGGQQYGNLTHIFEEQWDGDSYERYRVTLTEFAAYSDTVKYLVGLPERQSVYECSQTTCAYDDAHLLAEQLYWYDYYRGLAWPAENKGWLTAVRSLLFFDQDGHHHYNDAEIGYDAWGNVISTTQHTVDGEITLSNAGSQTTRIVYDTSYRTYPLQQINAKGQTTSWLYDYAKGLPTSETSPNGGVTTLGYDNFGRLTALRRPGDEVPNRATLGIGYFDSYYPSYGVPFMVDIQLKLSETLVYNLRKFYNGLGQRRTALHPLPRAAAQPALDQDQLRQHRPRAESDGYGWFDQGVILFCRWL